LDCGKDRGLLAGDGGWSVDGARIDAASRFTHWSGGEVAFIDTADGRVAYRYWPEAQGASRTLIGIHGIGGNSDNYIAVGEALKPDVALYAIELTGNGQSGAPGDVKSIDVHFRNLDALWTRIQKRHAHARHYVAGYSLGAAYAPAWITRRHIAIAGLLLFAPPFHNAMMLSRPWSLIFRIVVRLMPHRRIYMGPRKNGYSDPRREYVALSDGFITHRTLRSLKVSSDMVAIGRRALREIRIPALIIHGDEDDLARPQGALIAFDALSSEDKTLQWVHGGNHYLYDVLNGIKDGHTTDAQRALVLQPMREWLERH
jgi:alpha-beta hydrolase superfamily lysophospholipase